MLLRNKKIVGASDPVKNIGNLSPEVLVHIFSFLDSDAMLKCRLVSKQWKTVIDADIFRHLMDKKDYKQLMSHGGSACKWETFFLLWKMKSLGKNLLFPIIQSAPGNLDLVAKQFFQGQTHKIFNFPPLKDYEVSKSYFVLGRSKRWTKNHLINLEEKGFTADMLDTLQPIIDISVWYGLRDQSGCKYTYSTELLTERMNTKGYLRYTAVLADGKWKKMSSTFEKYGKGLAYVRITHQVISKYYRDDFPECIITGEVLRVHLNKSKDPTSPVDVKETMLSMFN